MVAQKGAADQKMTELLKLDVDMKYCGHFEFSDVVGSDSGERSAHGSGGQKCYAR
jgi:hypothetical protein